MQSRHYLTRPTKDEIQRMPPFAGLPAERILLVENEQALAIARRHIADSGVLGFDTESRPCFTADAPRTGPHLLQIATHERVFLFRPGFGAGMALLAGVIQSEQLVKAGFGLAGDRSLLRKRFGFRLCGAVDLASVVKRLGYRQQVGLQAAVAIVLGQYLAKPRRLATSDWASTSLSPAQRHYAAQDAYASLSIYNEIQRLAPHLLQSR